MIGIENINLVFCSPLSLVQLLSGFTWKYLIMSLLGVEAELYYLDVSQGEAVVLLLSHQQPFWFHWMGIVEVTTMTFIQFAFI